MNMNDDYKFIGYTRFTDHSMFKSREISHSVLVHLDNYLTRERKRLSKSCIKVDSSLESVLSKEISISYLICTRWHLFVFFFSITSRCRWFYWQRKANSSELVSTWLKFISQVFLLFILTSPNLSVCVTLFLFGQLSGIFFLVSSRLVSRWHRIPWSWTSPGTFIRDVLCFICVTVIFTWSVSSTSQLVSTWQGKIFNVLWWHSFSSWSLSFYWMLHKKRFLSLSSCKHFTRLLLLFLSASEITGVYILPLLQYLPLIYKYERSIFSTESRCEVVRSLCQLILWVFYFTQVYQQPGGFFRARGGKFFHLLLIHWPRCSLLNSSSIKSLTHSFAWRKKWNFVTFFFSFARSVYSLAVCASWREYSH